MNCPTCRHAEHPPGRCPQDNCGESELVHSDAIWSDIDLAMAPHLTTDYDPMTKKSVVRTGYQRRDVTRIHPRDTGWR